MEEGKSDVMEINTLEDVKIYAEENSFDLDKMRYLIGKDTKKLRIYGIFYEEDTNTWIVYHNRSTGQRAIHYSGESEQEACHVIYEKIKGDVEHRKKSISNHTRRAKAQGIIVLTVLIGILVIFALYSAKNTKKHQNGYYVQDDQIFYVQHEKIYTYHNDEWIPYNQSVNEKWYKEYYYGSNYEFEHSEDEFYYSPYYDEEYFDSNEDDEYDSNNDDHEDEDLD